jgi:hypothetical protein
VFSRTTRAAFSKFRPFFRDVPKIGAESASPSQHPRAAFLLRIAKAAGVRRGRARRGRYALESVAPEVASFGFGITIIEQGGARTEFHDGGARVAKLMPIYHHSFLRRLDPRNGLAPGDQEQMFALGPSRLRLMLLSLAFGGFPEDPVQTDASFEDRRKAPSRGTFRPGRDIYSIFFTRYDHLSKQLI